MAAKLKNTCLILLMKKFCHAALAALILSSVMNANFLQTKSLTASTGKPELIESGGGVMLAMTEEEYQKFAGQLTKMANFVPMKRKPANLSPKARFGINFVLEGLNRSWALDGDEKKGYVLYADLNANGDLSDDPPQRFEKKDGKYFLLFQFTARETNKEGAETYPVTFKLVVSQVTPPGRSQPQPCLLCYNRTIRRGTLQLGNRQMAFSLIGSGGIYNASYNYVFFDLDGDGKLDSETESYLISEKYVNIGETSYEFVVDRYGRSLTLNPLAEKMPPRVILLPGYPAPDFSFTDLDGKKRKLSDYRGKVVLLDFWGTWCGPCVAAVPKLVEAYGKLHAQGFEILGIDTDDAEEKLRAFIAEKKMPWAQALEKDGGPIQKLYRIVGFPTYYLIGKNGIIVTDQIDVEKLPTSVMNSINALR